MVVLYSVWSEVVEIVAMVDGENEQSSILLDLHKTMGRIQFWMRTLVPGKSLKTS